MATNTTTKEGVFTVEDVSNVEKRLLAVLEKKNNKYVTKREMFYITMHGLYGDKITSTKLSDEQIERVHKFGGYFADRFMISSKDKRYQPGSEIMSVLFPCGCRYVHEASGTEYNVYRDRIYNLAKSKTLDIEKSTCGKKSIMRKKIDETLTFVRSL